MKTLLRGSRILILLALFLTTITIFAQESTEEATPEATAEVTETAPTAAPEETAVPEATAETTPEAVAVDGPITVVGSGVVNPLLEALIAANASDLDFDIRVTGTAPGFEQFCAGEANIVTSSRTITLEENETCRGNAVEYLELLIGYQALTFISNPADDFVGCLTAENISTLFAPSSAGEITQWGQITFADDEAATNAEAEVTPEATAEVDNTPAITLLTPPENTALYYSLDEVVPGVGLRSDLSRAEETAIVETVSTTSGAVGVVSMRAAQVAGEAVQMVPITFSGDPANCVTPSIENIESQTYPAATLFLYINRNSQSALNPLLESITSDESAAVVEEAGFTALSAETYEINRAVISGEEENPFSEVEATYNISPTLAGSIDVGGHPAAFQLSQSAAQRLTANIEGFTVNNDFSGTTAGINAFCNGELEILFVQGDGTFTEEQQAICDENGVDSYTTSIGYQAVVLLSNADDSYTSCLTTEQLVTIWGAPSADSVTTWNQVSEAMPEQEMTLFGLPEGSSLSDFILTPPSGGAAVPVRLDTEQDFDALYRAAATANVPGSLTYMNWLDYQRVLENEQQNVQLVAVNAGEGCVVPSLETIQDGSYTLARETTMLVNYAALATPETQAVVWTIFDDANYSTVNNLGYIGLSERELDNFQEELLAEFDAAEAALAAAPESTPEATAEAEVTPEATEAQ